jgi:hypothetical protein
MFRRGEVGSCLQLPHVGHLMPGEPKEGRCHSHLQVRPTRAVDTSHMCNDGERLGQLLQCCHVLRHCMTIAEEQGKVAPPPSAPGDLVTAAMGCGVEGRLPSQ